MPDDWKLATVVPIFKSGDRTVLANYRPVSLTSVVCKLMEHLITNYEIRQEWEQKEWLFQGQHGFRNDFSCDSQMVSLFQDIADEVDDSGRVDTVIVDFAKAFDVVPHDKLVHKLLQSGIDTRVVAWIVELLRDRNRKSELDKNFQF